MSDSWTIDTVVLYECARLNTAASYFLSGVLYKKKRVAFDKDNRIESQYTDCLKEIEKKPEQYPASAFIKQWFIQVVNKLALKNSGYLQNEYEIALRELNFHDDDLIFVAVCHCSGSKKLVSSDSDYSPEVKGYLKSKMSIDAMSVEEAIDILNN